MTTTAENAGPAKQRRRRSSRGKSRSKNLLHHPKTGRIIAYAMGAVTLVYLALAAVGFKSQGEIYANIPLGSAPQEVLYFAGQPSFVRATGFESWAPFRDPSQTGQWLFERTSDRMMVEFDDAGRVAAIMCAAKGQATLRSCPGAMGVEVGQSELVLLHRLGNPSSERLGRGRKIMRYDEAGLEFGLSNMTIESIRLTGRRSPLFGLTGRFLLWAFP